MSTTPYSIGIVTYHARFETYFKPLIKKLIRIFPDRDIICIINGHPDRTLQMKYLKKAVSFLKTFQNVRYLTYDSNQSLAKCWNQTIIFSQTEKVLLLNDDTQVSELFRTELEEHIDSDEIFTVNRSWSHFVISKATVKKVGWFEERLLGIGQEDGDYTYRLAIQNMEMKNIDCAGIRNFVAEQENPGWSTISTNSTGNRYANINQEFFNTKWLTPLNSTDIKDFTYTCQFNASKSPFTLVPGMETPNFYDFSVLENKENTHTFTYTYPSKLLFTVQKIYFILGRQTARLLRKIKFY